MIWGSWYEGMQMTLNAFHQAGQRANVSLSFPSYKELINGSKVPKNSNMTIYFEEKKSLEEAMRFGFQNVEYHELKDFANAKILNPKEEVIPEWYRFALLYTPQYHEIIPSREELIKLLARNKNIRKQILQKLRETPKK
jgi:RNA polymerase Rpb1, domain 5